MRKLFVTFCLVFTLSFCGCGTLTENDNSESFSPIIDGTPPVLDVVPPVDTIPPTPDYGTEDGGEESEEDIKKKKYYIVSKVDGLRVRSSANTSSQVLGTLDKLDAVTLISKVDGFYKTIYKEKTAYVSEKYVSVMEIDYEDDKSESAIDLGCTLLGYPYVWGSQRYHWGNGKLNRDFKDGEFDCSALTLFVYYKSNGVILDLTSRAQVYNGKEVKRSELKRGDLMFFTNAQRQYRTGNERIGHVGIYFGNNYILHTASDHAVIEPISQTRWGYYITARRVV